MIVILYAYYKGIQIDISYRLSNTSTIYYDLYDLKLFLFRPIVIFIVKYFLTTILDDYYRQTTECI